MAGKVFAVASGKGGVGKTTTVVNLGVVLRRADHSVALIDADLGMANLGAVLDIEGQPTLHDILAGEATVEEALVEEAPGFGVLTGSTDLRSYPRADPGGLGSVIRSLAETYDVVIVDTGAGMGHEDILPLGLADRVLLVTSPDTAAIGDTRKTAELVELAGGTVAGLVVTMAANATDTTHVASQVGVELLGVIPFDPTVRESTATARPLEAVDPDAPAAAAYRELAAAIMDEPVDASLATGPGELHQGQAETDDAEPAVDESTPADGSDDGPRAPEPESPAEQTANRSTDDGGVDDESAGQAPDPEGAAGMAVETTPAVTEPTADDAETTEDMAAERPDSDVDSDQEVEREDDHEEDYLAEFEADNEGSSGGFLSKLGRLFR